MVSFVPPVWLCLAGGSNVLHPAVAAAWYGLSHMLLLKQSSALQEAVAAAMRALTRATVRPGPRPSCMQMRLCCASCASRCS